MLRRSTAGLTLLTLLLASGCRPSETPSPQRVTAPDVQTVRLHFDGFPKSKSGAT